MLTSPFYNIKDNDLIFSDSEKTGKNYVLRVKDLPNEEKPREKLVLFGPDALSVNELLAIVLTTGTKKEGVLSISSRIIKEYGEKTIIKEKNPKKITSELNVPFTKACQIIACFELGRRFFDKNSANSPTIRSAKDAFDYLKDMRELKKENLRGIYLNSHYKIVHDETISVGSFTSNIAHPREIFKPAIECLAVAVIVAHNHPSGIITPSNADIEITIQLREAGKILGIDFLDHIIIAKNKFISIPFK